MYDHVILSRGLRECLHSACTGTPSREERDRIILVSHALAATFLAGKPTAGKLCTMLGLSNNDLAYDCIADLFTRDEEGKYLQLRTYFSGVPLATAPDGEILAHLRRLIFAKVNQGIFRLYGEGDPSLARILRNIKLAVGSLRNFEERERFGESCIAPSLCEALEHKPAFSREELESSFFAVTTGTEMIPQMLSALALMLRNESERCRLLPLVEVGLLVRNAYERKALPLPSFSPAAEPTLALDVISIVQRASCAVKQRLRHKYEGRGKVSGELFELYFRVIHAELCHRLLGNDESDASLQERLRRELPAEERDGMFLSHRHKVEYLLKLVHREAVRELRAL